MDIKDKVTVWQGYSPWPFLQVQDRVDTELNLYYFDWIGVVGTGVGYGVGFVIVHAVFR